jgi:hypothetical protein
MVPTRSSPVWPNSVAVICGCDTGVGVEIDGGVGVVIGAVAGVGAGVGARTEAGVEGAATVGGAVTVKVKVLLCDRPPETALTVIG